MKRWLVFLLGLVSGAILTFLILVIIAYSNTNNIYGLTVFDTPGDVISTRSSFEVIQALDGGTALAHEINNYHLIVLLVDNQGRYFYDNQIVKIPEGCCARQIGIYQYTARSGINKTVPAVMIEEY